MRSARAWRKKRAIFLLFRAASARLRWRHCSPARWNMLWLIREAVFDRSVNYVILKITNKKNMGQETKTKKGKNETGGLTKFFLENIFGIVKSFVDGMFENAEKAAFVFTRKVIIRAFLIFFIFLGIIFLLIGMARLLSAEYQFP